MLLLVLMVVTLPIVQPVSQKSPVAPLVIEETPQLAEYTTSMYELVVVILNPWRLHRKECEVVPPTLVLVAVRLHELIWEWTAMARRQRRDSFKKTA
jgi:hypothetical protein